MGANISKISFPPPPIDAINCNLNVGPFQKGPSLSQLLDGYRAVQGTPNGWKNLKDWRPNDEVNDSLMRQITGRMQQYQYHSGASFSGLLYFLGEISKNGVHPMYLKQNAWRWIFGRYYLGRFPEIMGVLAIIGIARRFLLRTN